MEKKGDATVLETLNLFQVLGGILFFVLMFFALDYYYGAGNSGYSLSLSEQLNLGGNLVKAIDWDSGITYQTNAGVYLNKENIDIEKTSTGLFNRAKGSKEIIVEKKEGGFKVYEAA